MLALFDFDLPYVSLYNLTERRNLEHMDCPFSFLFENFVSAHFFKRQEGAWHVYKPLFGTSVVTCRLACSEISLSINEKKLERSPRKTTLAQPAPCFAL